MITKTPTETAMADISALPRDASETNESIKRL
jgi:hypothetical protein